MINKGGDLMKVFELCRKENMAALDPDQQLFTAKMIVREVQKIARKKNISEEKAYYMYTKGLFDADREIGDSGND